MLPKPPEGIDTDLEDLAATLIEQQHDAQEGTLQYVIQLHEGHLDTPIAK